MTRLGVLASHRGTNFQAIIDACRDGKLDAEPVIAISNNSDALALQRARAAGIPTVHLSSVTHPADDDRDAAMAQALREHNVDLLVLAGYMKKLGPETLSEFAGRIINIHPALLPRHGGKGMYGMNVHRAVLESGDRETGITVHWVEDQYDSGPIIAQRKIPVRPDDTPESLSGRVLAQEHDFLIETLGRILARDPALTNGAEHKERQQ